MPATTPSLPRQYVGGQSSEIGAADRRPLRLDDLVHLLERGAAVEQFARARIAGAAAQLRIVFQQMRGEPQRFLAQIARRGRIVGQHRHHVLGFEHRADAVADRLAAVGGDNLDRDAEMVADELEQLAQPHGLHGVGEFGRRSDRKIDQQMGRAGRELLRHDRGDHLLARIEAERPLDRDQDIVGRRQVDMAAPDQAAVTGRDHVLHLIDAEIDARQHLHGVGGAGRRGDGARGSLWES